MQKLLGVSAVALGIAGMLLCAVAVGAGWWAAVKTATRLDRVAARLDSGLTDVDVQAARRNPRVNAVHSDLNAAREAAETIAAEIRTFPASGLRSSDSSTGWYRSSTGQMHSRIRSGRWPRSPNHGRHCGSVQGGYPQQPFAFGMRPTRSIVERRP